MSKEIEEGARREAEMRYDHGFYTENGNYELCHFTGYEVYSCGIWWGEFEDADGNLHLGN